MSCEYHIFEEQLPIIMIDLLKNRSLALTNFTGVFQLQEFEAAIKQRDGIITQLTANLQQARREKDETMREFLELTEQSQKLQIQFQHVSISSRIYQIFRKELIFFTLSTTILNLFKTICLFHIMFGKLVNTSCYIIQDFNSYFLHGFFLSLYFEILQNLISLIECRFAEINMQSYPTFANPGMILFQSLKW